MCDDADTAAEMAGVDEAAKALNREDEAIFYRERANAAERRAARDSFRDGYRRKRRTIAVAKAKAQAKAKPRARAPRAPVAPRMRLPTAVAMDTMSQAEAKVFMPPRGSLWKSRTQPGSWHTELKPLPSCNRSISAHGFGGALRIVISDAWRNYALLEGLAGSELPENLEADVDAAVDDA